jgi:hypothetical protein
MNRMRSFWCITALMLVLGAFAGCGSDSTTPQDEVPALSEDNARAQAGLLSRFVSQSYIIYHDAIQSAANKVVAVETFTAGGISGAYTLDFRAADGTTPSPSGSAGWVRAYTDVGQQIEVRVNSSAVDPLVTCTFDVHADPYSSAGDESGTVNGFGTLCTVTGDTTTFTVENLVLNINPYPPDGALTYTAGAHHVSVEFDGDQTAAMTVGANNYTVNLDTGVVTPLGP